LNPVVVYAAMVVALLFCIGAVIVYSPPTRPCHRCGERLPITARRCRHCGYRFSD
jgi:tRNA(Ile2) C34 agmatinyltransferase TiaS